MSPRNVIEFFMHTSTPMCVLTEPHHTISVANKAFMELLQTDPTGHQIKEYIPTSETSNFLNALNQARASGATTTHRKTSFPQTQKNGSVTRAFESFTFYPLHDSQRDTVDLLLLAGDITELVRAQDQALEDLEKFRNLADAVPQMLFMATSDGNATFHNRRWLDYTGFSPKEAIGDSWRSLLHPDDINHCIQAWQNSAKTGQPYEIEYRLRRKDGVYRWHLGRALPMRNSEGAITQWYGSMTDIHEQKILSTNLAKATEESRLIIETIPNGIWRTSADGRADYYSHRFAELLGVNDQELLEWGWAERIHPEDQAITLEKWKAARENKVSVYLEFRFKHGNGTYRWYRSEGNPFFDEKGNLTRYYGTWTDIDALKKKSEELQAAKEAAESANQSKSAFLANMSHEIRTPLGVILGFAELLRETDNEKEKQHYYDIINRNGQALTGIIDDILDLSRIEAGRMKIEMARFSPKKIILEMLDVFQDKTQAAQIQLQTHFSEDFPEEIESDPARLRQILINIIGNAVKFTKHGSVTVDATLEVLADQRCKIHILVKDTGPGISQEQQTQLFKPFSQLDSSTTRQHGGTGLGLVLSRRLAQALGGDVTLRQSIPGEGSVFEITLNIQRPQISATKTTPPGRSSRQEQIDLSHLKVLMVDDSEDNRKLLQKILSLQGAHVDLACDGQEGLQMALAGHYDVVLLDIQMPQMDGYEVMRKLRLQKYQTPVIALTAHAMEEDRRQALEMGFTDYKTKPINIPDLLKTLQTLGNP